MISLVKFDSGDNIEVLIDGKRYKFATQEFYGGMSVYAVAFNGGDFKRISQSKKLKNLYEKYKVELHKFWNERISGAEISI